MMTILHMEQLKVKEIKHPVSSRVNSNTNWHKIVCFLPSLDHPGFLAVPWDYEANLIESSHKKFVPAQNGIKF